MGNKSFNKIKVNVNIWLDGVDTDEFMMNSQKPQNDQNTLRDETSLHIAIEDHNIKRDSS